ncbi:MAG: hypothetical protein M0Z40_15665 [Actinomycetota bacterium]|jgi:hypothetical protein|nr:hypothetical protein [Actinomycetota bacterium]MDA8314280.1 hypothetical protein [Actinomycetota bacterium]
MPRSSTGKWVARAGATGGGRTYRGQAPINWYAALVLIVIAGLVSIAFARMDYQRGAVASTVPPVKGGAPWFAAVTFDVCGAQRPPLPSNALDTAKQSFYTTGNGVITISPKTTGAAGHNAVLGKFVSSYKGLVLSATELRLPASPSSSSSKTSKKTKTTASSGTTLRNGQRCPAGSKDAGKKAFVTVSYWPNAFSSKAKPLTVSGSPSTLRFTNDQLITVGFVPAGTKLPKPNGTIVTALLDASAGSSSTPTVPPTSLPPTTPTTAGGSTSSTAPAPSKAARTTTHTTKAG